MKDRVILGGRAGEPLAKEVRRILLADGKAEVSRFRDGEVSVQLDLGDQGNVRGKDVFIINPTHMPHDNIFDLLMLTDAVRRSLPYRITLVVPYLAYNRQDRKTAPRTPISAAVMMKLLANSGADGILLLDVHSEATLGMLDPLKVDHLYGSTLAVPHFRSILKDPFVIAAPDHGAAGRARSYAKRLGQPEDWVIFDKVRTRPGETDRVTLIGDVAGKDVLLVDDMIDSGGTMMKDAIAAKANGARRVLAYATHGILSEGAVKKFDECKALDGLTITDSISHAPRFLRTKRLKIDVLPIAPLVARAIHNIHSETSISKLLD